MAANTDYVELRAHSWYSFGAGASSVAELVQRAAELDYPALGLTDVSNLCGALEFSQQCLDAGVHPIIGADLTVRGPEGDGAVALIAETGEGYANLCRLVSLAHLTGGRTEPVLDARFLESHAAGLIVLLGAPGGVLASLLEAGGWANAEALVKHYRDLFRADNVFLELQQHLAYGDTARNRRLPELAPRCGVGIVATNEVWYHRRDRSRLHDALTAIRLNGSLSEVRERLKVNGQYRLKSPAAMGRLFRSHPDARRNTRAIAERCSDFRLPNYVASRYSFPDVPVPPGHDAQSWLRRLCEESAARRYGRIDQRVRERLDEEFALIGKHGLAGFFLVYHRIVELAREGMLELGWGHLETPLEWLPPGRGRGSSVSMLVGYLIGLSHVDPLAYGLTLAASCRPRPRRCPTSTWTSPGTSADKGMYRVSCGGVIGDLEVGFGFRPRLRQQPHPAPEPSLTHQLVQPVDAVPDYADGPPRPAPTAAMRGRQRFGRCSKTAWGGLTVKGIFDPGPIRQSQHSRHRQHQPMPGNPRRVSPPRPLPLPSGALDRLEPHLNPEAQRVPTQARRLRQQVGQDDPRFILFSVPDRNQRAAALCWCLAERRPSPNPPGIRPGNEGSRGKAATAIGAEGDVFRIPDVGMPALSADLAPQFRTGQAPVAQHNHAHVRRHRRGQRLQQFHYRVHPGPGFVGAQDAPGHGNRATPVDHADDDGGGIGSFQRRVNRQCQLIGTPPHQDPPEQRREAEAHVQFGLAGTRPVPPVVQPFPEVLPDAVPVAPGR